MKTGLDNILLLNPPADKICIRDYFCSKTSRSGYLFAPIDLLMLSGRLYQDYNLLVMDSIVEKLSVYSAIKKIKHMDLRAIVSLVGAVSWESDLDFLKRIKKVNPVPIICIGDITLEKAKDLLTTYSCIDAILLDFVSDDALKYLRGDLSNVKNMVLRLNGAVVERGLSRDRMSFFNIPYPRHELFLKYKNYSFPFAKGKRFTVVLTDFGCPFDCQFCIISTLGYKYREVNNVLEELEYIHTLCVEEIFFIDQCFGAIKQRNNELCGKMIEKKFNFGWTCFSRADILDENTLALMKKAGCHTVIIGVESGDEDILRIYKKGYDLKKVISVFNLCRKMKIRTVGTFIIGLPEDTRESCLKTIDFAKRLNCDFASFHVAVPRPGTGLRTKAVGMHIIADGFSIMDQSGSNIIMATQNLSKPEIAKIKNMANRQFYLRPSYLLNRILSCDSLKDFFEQFREFFILLSNNI